VSAEESSFEWGKPDETTVQARRLADELRRLVNRLVIARPTAEALAAAADVAAGFADRLDALPSRDSLDEVSEAALLPRSFIDHSPVSGRSNPIAPPLTMRIVTGDDGSQHIEGDVTFGAAYEGPPGHVHGGFVAAMFDELLGFAQLAPGYTARLTINYRRRTPLNTPLHLEAAVESEEGRKRVVRGSCRAGGELLSDAEGLFIAPRETSDPLHKLMPRDG
jgi:acyl-coenzyme A thioesterase PaaI-like protein